MSEQPSGRGGRRRAVRLGAVAVATALALVGCGRAPSTAAEVGGTTISNAELESAIEGTVGVLGEQEGLGTDVLTTLVRGAAVDEVVARSVAAGRDELVISQAERNTFMASQPGVQRLAEVPAAAPVADALADFTILQQRMGSEDFVTAITAVPVEVNPRWGAWQPEQAAVAGGGGALSVESYAE